MAKPVSSGQLQRLVQVMHELRTGCPWDAEQTHLSLAKYLIEESAEVLEAIENADDVSLREELGDLLLQIVFHAEIAAEEGRFTLDDVARGISDKLVARHPYVFIDAAVPDDVLGAWERAKKAEKGRRSALDGIPPTLNTLARATKVVSRARAHGVMPDVPSDPALGSQGDLSGGFVLDASADSRGDSAQIGREMLDLVVRAQASGVDPDQALRAAVRELERAVSEGESAVRESEVAVREGECAVCEAPSAGAEGAAQP